MRFANSQKGQSSMVIGGVIVLVVILAGVAYFMMQKGSNNTTPTEQMQGSPTATEQTTETQGDAMPQTEGKRVTFQVDGSSFKFSPSTISVNEGDTVTIKFVNTGGLHDFVIDEFGVKTKQLANGVSEEITFVANKKGTFEYYCSVGNHRQMGMVGTFTVN